LTRRRIGSRRARQSNGTQIIGDAAMDPASWSVPHRAWLREIPRAE
jgi:hypothetical protein